MAKHRRLVLASLLAAVVLSTAWVGMLGRRTAGGLAERSVSVPARSGVPAAYRGTTVRPHPEARDERLALQEVFARLLSRMDLQPEGRLAHFRWMKTDPDDVVLKGWFGTVREVVAAPEGGFLIKVRFVPDVTTSISATTFCLDSYDEVYEFTADGAIRFVEGVAGDGSPGSFIGA